MKKVSPEEEQSILLYRNHNISEWREKCLILSDTEKQAILHDLEEGIDSPLVELVKMPFPKFAEIYYRRFEGAKKYLDIPGFGYKLYIMRDSSLKMINAIIKNPKATCDSLVKKLHTSYDSKETIELLETPLEQISKLNCSNRSKTSYEIKLAYIMQYIDKEEAERLKLSGFTFYKNGEYRGFDLEGKLDSLNECVRIIICRTLGLYGGYKKSGSEIATELKIPSGKVNTLINYVLPSFSKSTGELRNKIGYIDRPYESGESREYSNREYRDLDLNLQIMFIYENMLSEEEKKILSTRSNKEMRIYIAKKYIYDTNEQVARNLTVIPEQVASIDTDGEKRI